jgi:hypothetical protein
MTNVIALSLAENFNEDGYGITLLPEGFDLRTCRHATMLKMDWISI